MLGLTKEKDRFVKSDTVSAGSTTEWIYIPSVSDKEVLVACMPGSGGTMRAEYTLDSEEDIALGSETAFAWDSGDVSADAAMALPSNITAVRFVAATQDGTYRVVL